MTPWLDARIPVLVGADLRPGDAALVEQGAAAPPGVPQAAFAVESRPEDGHLAGCACCAARTGAAVALDRLFLRRARGEVAFFGRVTAVLATAAGEASLRAALDSDPVVSARYRLDPAQPA